MATMEIRIDRKTWCIKVTSLPDAWQLSPVEPPRCHVLGTQQARLLVPGLTKWATEIEKNDRIRKSSACLAHVKHMSGACQAVQPKKFFAVDIQTHPDIGLQTSNHITRLG